MNAPSNAQPEDSQPVNTVLFMAQYGATMLDNGWPVLPIMPGTKAPGRFLGDRWVPLGEWSRLCDRPTKSYEVDIWSTWPGCAVGIPCGVVVGFDIDVLDADLAYAIERMTVDTLGETPLRRIGQAPKRMLVYRSSEPFPGRKRRPIELLARGQQFLSWAIHPETLRPYEWTDESPLTVALADVPAITEEQALAWLDRAYAMVPEHLRPKSTLIGNRPSLGEHQGSSDPRGTLEAITAALAFIPNNDLDGASWITIGHALKAALGEDGRELWLDWSRQSAKSGRSGASNTPEKRWAGFRPHSVGAGTIYHQALERGCVPPPGLILNGTIAELAQGPHPAAALLDRLAAKPAAVSVDLECPASTVLPPEASENPPQSEPIQARPAKMATLPPQVFEVEGALRLFLDDCEATAMSRQPFQALAAGICAIGALVGRKYRTTTDLRTNIYAVGIADSGGGKDHARKRIKAILGAANLVQYLGGEDIASGTAVFAALSRHPALLFQIDELGDWLSDVLGKKAPAHKRAIAQKLKSLYSSANTFVSGAEYADQSRQGRPREDIQQPHACFYGTTTPAQFWNAIAGGSLYDGLMARMLVFVAPESFPEEQEPSLQPPSPELVAAFGAIAEGPDHSATEDRGNLAGLMLATIPHDAFTVPETPAATEVRRTMRRDQLAAQRSVGGTYATAIIGRLTENAMKLALVRAVSRNPLAPCIEEIDVTWGRTLAEHCINSLLHDAERYVSDSEYEARMKKALDIIQKRGPVTERDLLRSGFRLPEKDRAEVLRTLVAMGAITASEVRHGGAGRPTIRYAAVARDATLQDRMS